MMKKHKIEKEFEYLGLGFPITLKNIPMIEIRGVWTPDIDLNILQKVVVLDLAHRSSELTGNQIRFIRQWLGFTQTEFGKLLGVTHPAVVKWEKSGDKFAKVSLPTQRDLRLLILDQLLMKDEDFRQAFRVIHNLKFTQSNQSLVFDAPIDLVAI